MRPTLGLQGKSLFTSWGQLEQVKASRAPGALVALLFAFGLAASGSVAGSRVVLAATPALNPAVISVASEAGSTVTITTAQAHGLQAGTGVAIAGVKANGYNGSWTIKSTTSTTFTYVNSVTGLARSSGGTAMNGIVKPDAFGIRLPWASGVQHSVTQAYGTVHDGVLDHWNFSSGGAQDYYAIDFDLAQGEAIYPIATGTVKYAGWGGTNIGCVVVIDHVVPVTTTHIWSLYGHLGLPGYYDSSHNAKCSTGANAGSTTVATGAAITDTTKPIGYAGYSGHVIPSGPSGTHLHFALYMNTKNNSLKLASGWDGYGKRPTGGISVIPEPFVGDRVYENFEWWSGPLTAAALDSAGAGICSSLSSGGVTRKCKWTIAAGQSITSPIGLLQFKLQATAPTGIKEVHLIIHFQPDDGGTWPYDVWIGFRPGAIWPIVAACKAPDPGGPLKDASGCIWSNIVRNANGRVVAAEISYAFGVATLARAVPYLPKAKAPWPTTGKCVPVALNFNVYDTAGRRKLGGDTDIPTVCPNQKSASARAATLSAASAPKGQVVYLRPSSSGSASGEWPMFHFDIAHTGYSSGQSTISPENASQLSLMWSSDSDGSTYSTPAIANAMLYVVAESAGQQELRVFAAQGCGAATCGPLWTAPAGMGSSDAPSPTVDGGYVFVNSANPSLLVFDADGCGSSVCSALWTGTSGRGSPPVVYNGLVYDGGYNVNSYPVGGCGQTNCIPTWTGAVQSYGDTSSPSIAGGMLYVSASLGRLDAFDLSGCSRFPCEPAWSSTARPAAVSAPAIMNGVIYRTVYGTLYANSAAGCGQADCDPMWSASVGDYAESSPAVANGVVFVGGPALTAFPAAGCGQPTCSPLWTTEHGSPSSAPSIAGRLVFVPDYQNLYAYDVDGCGSESCDPLWTSPAIGYSSSPAIAGGLVYVAGNAVYAFGLPN